ncbi:MAG: type 1 glutamine amidotransferase [Rhodobacteraceae bacterium]|nr:type 1 glutamine amidotransferase [Paracoccaceae bacterium]
MVRIAILNLTDLPEEIGGGALVGGAIRDWLAPAMPGDELTIIEVTAGVPVPQVGTFDGFVLSGSEKGVYDAAPWMAPVRALLLETKARKTPVFGICFAHQFMAEVYGGKAELAELGEVVGVRRFEVDGQVVDAHVWHRDQVTKAPPGARVLGRADYCPLGVLTYDFPAMSVQFHPEFTAAFLTHAITKNQGIAQTPAETKDRLASVASGDVPVDLMAKEVAKLLRSAPVT